MGEESKVCAYFSFLPIVEVPTPAVEPGEAEGEVMNQYERNPL